MILKGTALVWEKTFIGAAVLAVPIKTNATVLKESKLAHWDFRITLGKKTSTKLMKNDLWHSLSFFYCDSRFYRSTL